MSIQTIISVALAQAASRGRQMPTTELLLTIGGLIAAVMVLGAIFLVLRRRALDNERGGLGAASLMAELRGMRDRGELTLEEFDRARSRLAMRAAGREPPAATDNAGPISSLPTPAITRPKPAPTPIPPPPRTGQTSDRVARPGFDLTGSPLPRPQSPPGPPRSPPASRQRPAPPPGTAPFDIAPLDPPPSEGPTPE